MAVVLLYVGVLGGTYAAAAGAWSAGVVSAGVLVAGMVVLYVALR